MAGNEIGRRIYHRRWDVQDRKWQVMRCADEFTTGDETSKIVKWQVMRWEDKFTTGDGMSKMGSGR